MDVTRETMYTIVLSEEELQRLQAFIRDAAASSLLPEGALSEDVINELEKLI